MSRSIFWLLLMVLLPGMEVFAQKAEIPKRWQQMTAYQFTFILPGDLQSIQQYPIDSCLAAFESNDIVVSLDYGFYSNPGRPDSENDYKKTSIKLNGRKAELITYVSDTGKVKTDKPFGVQVRMITKFSKKDRPLMATSLLFRISAKDPETIDQIVKSIKFLGD